MHKQIVFISYDYSNDRHYKNLLLAWDKNKEFDFTFYDASVDVSVDSRDPAAIKRVISTRINAASRFLCIVGTHTHKSEWVTWEIQKATDLHKQIAAVKIARDNVTPASLYGIGVKWALAFTFDNIESVLH